jgi:basic membrane lipoprotein Med (substrate-binding protein (PBP1-ABC) superfamily)
VIGSVNGYAFPLLTRQPEGFALGARCVNPKVKFEQKYINSWTDVQLANSATTSMMTDGADIILSAGDTDIQGMYTAAAKKPNTYIVSQYADSYSAAPKVVLTSALYGFDKVLNQLFTKALHHQLKPREQDIYTLKDVGGLAALRQHASFVGAANMKKVAQYQQWIASGKIRVPADDNVIGKVGAGTKIDPKSIGC